MSTSAVSSTPVNQQLQQYFQTRQHDLQQLGQALKSGDLAAAKTAFSHIVSLGQSGPFASGNAFKISQRQQDFAAIGQALQSGDLGAARNAFEALKDTFHSNGAGAGGPGGTLAQTAPGSAGNSGPEIILNLSNSAGSSASPEQITINIANSANGGEQVSFSVGHQGSNPQEVTLNLPANSNEQIVLNLLASSSSTGSGANSSTTGGSSASGGLSVTA
jgi:hypothetical protein